MSRVSRIIKSHVSVFSLLIVVLLLPSLEFISHAWHPIVNQKTAKQTFGEAPMTGNVFFLSSSFSSPNVSLVFPLAGSASVKSTLTYANASILIKMEINSGHIFGSLGG